MNKIISNPWECGYCNIGVNYRDNKCRHPKIVGSKVCESSTKFPDNCPLQNGVAITEICRIKTLTLKVICFLFGHKWKYNLHEDDGFIYHFKCSRCKSSGWVLSQMPKMTDEYIEKHYPIP